MYRPNLAVARVPIAYAMPVGGDQRYSRKPEEGGKAESFGWSSVMSDGAGHSAGPGRLTLIGTEDVVQHEAPGATEDHADEDR